MMTTKADLHNKLAGEIVAAIAGPILASGGTYDDVLVLLESVVVGITLLAIKFGRDEQLIDMMMERVRRRLAEIRLGDIEVAGNA